MNNGFQLYQLQEIDTNLNNSRNRIIEIDALLENNKTITLAQRNVEQAKNNLLINSNEFSKINDEVQKKINKISQSESSLYDGSVRNPKELEDLQLEISSLKKLVQKLDDTLVELLIRVDESEKELSICTDQLIRAKSDFATQEALLQGEKNTINNDILVLRSKRQSLIAQIDKNNLDLYEKLKKNKHGLAIIKIEDDACGACGAGLTASQRQEARSATTLFICPSCQRIIYGSS